MSCQCSAPDVKITKEHVIPQWIETVLTADLVGGDMPSERVSLGPTGVNSRSAWVPNQLAGAEIRGVCQQCNNGWMSEPTPLSSR